MVLLLSELSYLRVRAANTYQYLESYIQGLMRPGLALAFMIFFVILNFVFIVIVSTRLALGL